MPDWQWVAGHRLAVDGDRRYAVGYYKYRLRMVCIFSVPSLFVSGLSVCVISLFHLQDDKPQAVLLAYLGVALELLALIGAAYYWKWYAEGQGLYHGQPHLYPDQFADSELFVWDPEVDEPSMRYFILQTLLGLQEARARSNNADAPRQNQRYAGKRPEVEVPGERESLDEPTNEHVRRSWIG